MTQLLKVVITKKVNYEIISYASIGIISTLIHVAIAYYYIFKVNNSVFQANIIGFFVAYFFSFTMQSKYVFKNKINFSRGIKYFLVQIFSLIISIIIISDLLEYNNYIKVIFTIMLLPLFTFIIHKFWTYK